MAFDDTKLPVKVTTDTTDLKQLIRDFDGSTEAAKRLEEATARVKTQYDAQRKAISAFNQAQRINNFEVIQALRLVRSFSSAFSSLNQVYQTLILRQISATQTSVAQNEAFERIIDTTDNIVNALDILGEGNEEVDSALSSLITKADSLNSKQLAELIANYESAGNKANFTAGEQAKFNETLDKLKKLLEETKLEEKQKEFEDFFGVFTAAGTAVGSIGTLALNLAKLGPQLASAAGFISRFKPELAIIIVLLFGKDVAVQLGLLQTAGDGEDLTNKTDLIQDLSNALNGKGVEGAPTLGDPSSFFGRIGDPHNKPISINVEKIELTSDADLYKWAEIVYNKFKQEDSKRLR